MKTMTVCSLVALFSLAIAFGSVSAAETLVFEEVFEDPELPGISESQGYESYGFGDWFMRIPIGPITLNLDGLPNHTGIRIQFLLAIIDSWDGLTGRMSPDYLQITADGKLVFNNAFDNTYWEDQSPDVRNEVTVENIVYSIPIAYTAIFKDSAYLVSFTIPHSAPTASITWKPKWKGIGFLDESFAIDSIQVYVIEDEAPLVTGRQALNAQSSAVTGTWILPKRLNSGNK